jgi:hypothetical protein
LSIYIIVLRAPQRATARVCLSRVECFSISSARLDQVSF